MNEEHVYAVEAYGPPTLCSARVVRRTAKQVWTHETLGSRTRHDVTTVYATPAEAWQAFITGETYRLENAERAVTRHRARIVHAETALAGALDVA